MPGHLLNLKRRTGKREAAADDDGRALQTLNSISDAVVSVDLDDKLVYLNAAAEEITGWPSSEAIGQPANEVLRLIDGLSRNPLANPLARVLARDECVLLAPQSVLCRRDGSEVAIEDSASPIHDEHGQISGAVMVFRDSSAARTASLRLSYLAHHDALTDLPNRVLLKDRLDQAITLARRNVRKLALLYIDLDGFKEINDSLGHAVGDLVLQAVSHQLVASVRGADTVSRVGGDEFVVLVSEITQDHDATVIADKIQLALAVPQRICGHDIVVGASIGIAIYPGDGAEAEIVIHHADLAMYGAKNDGGRRYRHFSPDINTGSVGQTLVERSLRRGIEQHELNSSTGHN